MKKYHNSTKKILSKLSEEEKLKLTYIKEDNSVGPKYNKAFFKVYDDDKSSLPSNSSLAMSFDKALIKEAFKAKAKEAKALSSSIVKTPPLTLKRNPLSGFSFNYLSEDHIFNGLVVKEAIEALKEEKCLPLVSGFLNSDMEYSKYNISYIIDDKNLFENYFTSLSILPKYSDILLSLPPHKINNSYLYKDKEFLDLIRENTAFKGHFIAPKGAYIRSEKYNNGVLLSYEDDNETNINSSLINDSLLVITELSNTYKIKNNSKNDYSVPSILSAILTANSGVLLKNDDNILPLKDESIALLGLYQEYPITNGLFSDFRNKKASSLHKELKKYAKDVMYYPLYDIYQNLINFNEKELYDFVKSKDRVIIVLSDINYYVRDGIDRTSLRFKDEIYDFYKKIASINPNIITILELTSRVELKEVSAYSKGLMLYYPSGDNMNEGISMNLYGSIAPSGRLTDTYVDNYSDYLQALNHNQDTDYRFQSESIYTGYKYFKKSSTKILYPFGYGLSYSNFEIKNFNVSYLKNKHTINLSFKIKNIGNYNSMTPIMIFYSIKESDTFRASECLLDFTKVYLEKKEDKIIKMSIPDDYLKVYDFISESKKLEDGEYTFKLYLSTDNLLASRTINLNTYENIEDDLRYNVKPYYVFSKESFSLSLFDILYKKPFVGEKEPFSENIISKDIKQYTNTNDEYNRLKNMILERSKTPQERYINNYYLNSIPLRLIPTYTKVISKDEIKELINEVRNKL